LQPAATNHVVFIIDGVVYPIYIKTASLQNSVINMSNHTFTEEEITRIIKKAAQLESQQQGMVDAKPGLTLEELVRAASDAGLDPENIRIVAREIQEGVATEDISLKNNFRGQVFAERWIEGRLSDELADSVIADLKHRYDASEAERSWFREWYDEEWEENFGKLCSQNSHCF